MVTATIFEAKIHLSDLLKKVQAALAEDIPLISSDTVLDGFGIRRIR